MNYHYDIYNVNVVKTGLTVWNLASTAFHIQMDFSLILFLYKPLKLNLF